MPRDDHADLVGKSTPRVDAVGKVTGEALFPGDIDFESQAYGKVVFSGRPHARIRRIDTTAATELPGVLAVLTAGDVPCNEYGLIHNDQPVLCGPGSDKPFADRVRFIGDQVAFIVAESESLAELAASKIEIEYEDLPVLLDPIRAMEDDAFLIHPNEGSNVFHHLQIRKGDASEAISSADIVIEGEYQTPAQEHAFLQPEAGVSYIDEEGRIVVLVAGQWPHKDREQIAHALRLPEEKIRVVYPAIGGAFGGKEDLSIEIVLALAVFRLQEKGLRRAVKVVWSREESIIGHVKRHPFIFKTKWGATYDGSIVAAHVKIIQDGGAYASTSPEVLANAQLSCTGPYEIPNIHVDSFSVYTNHIPNGAFRGFGGPQGTYAAEMQISKTADALGLDPAEVRDRNLLRGDARSIVDSPMPKGLSIDKVLHSCASGAGWKKDDKGRWRKPERSRLGKPPASSMRRGIGIACAFKNVGFSFGYPEQSAVSIELHGGAKIEEVVLYHSGADLGQGSHTVLAQMAAEAVGVSVDSVRMVLSDTAHTEDAGSTSASRMTFMAGNAIQGAAEIALRRWHEEDRPAQAAFTFRPPPTTIYDPASGAASPNFSYGYVATAVVVDVDIDTGHIQIRDVTCAVDVGKAINPQQVEGQIEGAIAQAAGYALMEDFQQAKGTVQTKHLSTYLIPGVLDVPESVVPLILEEEDPLGPWGARGMAEMPLLPFAPALVAAVHDAVGVWFDEFPLKPERVFMALRTTY